MGHSQNIQETTIFMKEKLLIGIDFGSDSVRAVLVNENGENLATAVSFYPRWKEKMYCNAAGNLFRQHPLDYLESMTAVLLEVLENQDRSAVAGIGVDSTGSTPCAVNADGVPLALLPEFSGNPNAMFILWKDHTAVAEAEKITLTAKNSPVDYTMYCGGSYSSEWFWAKYLHILKEDVSIRRACRGFVENCDWITSLLAGVPVKAGRCAAGHKALWHASWGGLPPEEFFTAVDPLLAGRRGELYTDTFTADIPVGKLSAQWAEKLGLSTDVVIAGGVLDAHAGAVGTGIKPGELVKVFGTSTCDMLVTPSLDRCIPGICGQVDGSIVPGMIGLEAGQSAFGDIYAWFKNVISYGGEVSMEKLSAEAALLPDNEIISLDWMNGRRTPDANNSLTGAIFGLNLGSSAPMIFKSLVESTVFGAKRIVDRFVAEGIGIEKIIAVGGIAGKSPYIMQLCADVLDMPIKVSAAAQSCALGSAMLAAAAAGVHENIAVAMQKMHAGYAVEYLPDKSKKEMFRKKYERYLQLGKLWETEIMEYYRQ